MLLYQTIQEVLILALPDMPKEQLECSVNLCGDMCSLGQCQYVNPNKMGDNLRCLSPLTQRRTKGVEKKTTMNSRRNVRSCTLSISTPVQRQPLAENRLRVVPILENNGISLEYPSFLAFKNMYCTCWTDRRRHVPVELISATFYTCVNSAMELVSTLYVRHLMARWVAHKSETTDPGTL